MTTNIPKSNETFNQTENYRRIEQIIASEKFFPTWITGPKGCGKTETIKQVCAEHQREFIRLNFNQETDESELIGSQRLKGGDSTFHYGPVVEALKTGAVLLLDEIDVAHPNKVLCLQSVLEGNGVHVKATNEHVYPEPGFQIFATSNTKGRGCDTGEYIGTNIMNGAFLDRFAATIEQSYPTPTEEEEILRKNFAQFNYIDKGISEISEKELEKVKEFIARLCVWASHIRKNYEEEKFDEVISTRSLINIIKSYSIFDDEKYSIQLCCQRYSTDVSEAFISLYSAMHEINDAMNTDLNDAKLDDYMDNSL
jgi:MoxR-like ATPase